MAANCTSLLGFLPVTKVFRSLPVAGTFDESDSSGGLAAATGKDGCEVCVSSSARVGGASAIFSRTHRKILSCSSGPKPLSAAATVRTASRSSGFAIKRSTKSDFGCRLSFRILANKETVGQREGTLRRLVRRHGTVGKIWGRSPVAQFTAHEPHH